MMIISKISYEALGVKNYNDKVNLYRETSLYLIETEGQYVRSISMDCLIFNRTTVHICSRQ